MDRRVIGRDSTSYLAYMHTNMAYLNSTSGDSPEHKSSLAFVVNVSAGIKICFMADYTAYYTYSQLYVYSIPIVGKY